MLVLVIVQIDRLFVTEEVDISNSQEPLIAPNSQACNLLVSQSVVPNWEEIVIAFHLGQVILGKAVIN